MHVPTRDDKAVSLRHSAPKHLDQNRNRIGSTASFVLMLALTVSMLLSLVPTLAWAEVVDNYAELGAIIAEQMGADRPVVYDRPADDADAPELASADPADLADGNLDVLDEPAEPSADADTPAPADADTAASADTPADTADADTGTFTYADDAVTVTATVAYASSLPADATLEAAPITPDTPGYDDYLATADAATPGDLSASNTLLYDVHFVATVDGELREVEPEGPVTVRFDFNQAQLSEGIAAENSDDVQVTHLLDDGAAELMNADVNVAAETGETDAASFTTTSFSVFAFSYTVDVAYNGYTYSFPGQGSYALTDVLAALHIDATVDDATLALVVGEDVEGALYLTQPDGVWYLNSDVAFSSTYELTVTSGDATYVITVTDVVEESDKLLNFLVDMTISGATVDADGNYSVNEGETYSVTMYFAEGSQFQFKNEGELTYTLPTGVSIPAAIDEKSLTINFTFTDPTTNKKKTVDIAAEYSVDTEGKLTVKFTEKDENKLAELRSATNTSFHFSYEAEFSKKNSLGEITDKIKRTITVGDAVPGDAYATKTGAFNSKTRQMDYTITVTASGNVNNVSISDELSGSAVSLAGDITVKNGSGADATAVDSSKYTITKNDDGNGFSGTINSMTKGEVIVITYSADVAYDQDGDKDGSLTYDQTKNSVTVTAQQDNPHSAEYGQTINYRTTSKSNGTLVSTDTDGNKVVSWTVRYNELAVTSAAGSTITDTIDAGSAAYMSYGDGSSSNFTISIKKYTRSGDTLTAAGEEEAAPDMSTDGTSWVYKIPDTDNQPYVYEITYKTVVDQSQVNAAGRNISLSNDANGSVGTYNVGPVGDTTSIAKSVESFNTDEVNWVITLTIPKNVNLTGKQAQVVETLPSFYYGEKMYYDTVALQDSNATLSNSSELVVDDSAYTITGLEGEYYKVTVKLNERDIPEVYFRFYSSENETTQSLTSSTTDRTITINLKTQVDQDWLEIGYNEDLPGWQQYWIQHTNKATFNGNDASANVIFSSPGLTKTGRAITDGTNRVIGFYYEIVFSGVTDKDLPLVINDTFDTSMLQVDDSKSGQWDHMRIWGGNQYDQGNGGTPVTYTQTANGITLTAGDVPMQPNGTYYSHYRIAYYLSLKDPYTDSNAAYADLESTLDRLARLQGGEYSLTNTARWGDYEDDYTYTTTYDFLDKQLLNEAELGDPDNDGDYERTGRYQITLNPAGARINHGEPITMTDTLGANLALDVMSIKITDKDGAELKNIPYKIDYNRETNETIVTYTVPDATPVYVTYSAILLGNNLQNFVNTVEAVGRSEVVQRQKNMGQSAAGEASAIDFDVIKVDGNDANVRLQGVQFEFFAENTDLTFDKDGNVPTLTFETDAEGHFNINSATALNTRYMPAGEEDPLNGAAPLIYFNERYHLREVNTPAGYQNLGFDYLVTFVSDPANIDHVKAYTFFYDDSLHIENWPLEGLVIEKRVESANEADLNGEYKFEVSLLDDSGNVKNETVTYGGTTFTNGVAKHTDSKGNEVGLKNGEQWVITGLPAGTKYRVTETSTGYTTSYVATHVVTASNGTSTSTSLGSGADTSFTGTTATNGEGADHIVFTNSATGQLRFTKLVTLNNNPTTGTLADGTYTFTMAGTAETPTANYSATITATIDKGEMASASLTVDGGTESSLELKDGYVVIPDLTPGTYTITEFTPTNSYVQALSSSIDSVAQPKANEVKVEVQAGATGTAAPLVTFTNNVSTGDLTISKKLMGGLAADTNRKFTFQVYLYTDETLTTPATLKGTFGPLTFTATPGGDSTEASCVSDTFTLTANQSLTVTGLPVGLYYKVVETTTSGFTLTGRTIDNVAYSGSVDNGISGQVKSAETTVEFTNTRETGGFTVKKVVEGLVVSTDPTSFTFTVTLDDTTINGDYGTYGTDNAKLTFNNGVAPFALKNGEEASFSGLPVGVEYTVTEAHANGFTTNWTKTTPSSEEGESDTSATGDTAAAGTVTSNVSPTITATNTRETGSLTLGKTTVTAVGSERTHEFTFHVELVGTNLSGTFNATRHSADSGNGTGDSTPPSVTFNNGVSTSEIKLRGGDTLTIEGLPAGVTYVVTEDSAPGYTTAYSGSTGTIAADSTLSAVVTNVQNAGGLTVTKNVLSTGSDSSNQSFNFTITLKDENGNPVNGTSRDGYQGKVRYPNHGADASTKPYLYAPFNANGQATFELRSGEVAVVVRQETTTENEVEKTVDKVDDAIPENYSYSIEETSTSGYIVSSTNSSGTIVKNETSVAAFTNTRLGSLRLTKLVTVNGGSTRGTLADGDYTFQVRGVAGTATAAYARDVIITITNGVMTSANAKDPNVSGSTYTVISVSTPTGSEDKYVELTDLVPGTYTVQEVATKATDGNVNTNVTLDKTVRTVEVAAGANGTLAPKVTITNNLGAGSLTVSKQLVDATAADANTEFEFTVTLYTDASLETKATNIGDETDGAVFGGMIFKGGVATFNLKGGQSMVATGLPIGLYYKVEEKEATNGTAASNFTLTSITGSQGATNDVAARTSSGSITSAASSATFTNTRDTGGLEVAKKVDSVQNADKQRQYSFTVTLFTDSGRNTVASSVSGVRGGMTFTNGVATFTLADGQSVEAQKLPTGLYYRVEETTPEGFTTTWNSNAEGTATEGSIVKDATPTVTATNWAPGSLLLSKAVLINGVAPNRGTQADGTYSFTIAGPKSTYRDSSDTNAANGDAGTQVSIPVTITIKNGVIISGKVNGSAATLVTVGNETFVEVKNLRAGRYTITEKAPVSGSGITLDKIEYGFGSTANTTDRTVTVIVAPGRTGTNVASTGRAKFTNNMQTGALEFTKLVTINSDPTTGTAADGEYIFRVVGPTDASGSTTSAPSTTRTISINIANGKAQSATVDGVNQSLADGYVQLNSLVPGDYTVTEVSAPVVTTLTGIEVRSGDTKSGETENQPWTATIHVASGQAASAHTTTYTNNAVTGSLWLTKLVTVEHQTPTQSWRDSERKLADGTYSFTIEGPSDSANPVSRTVTITIENGAVKSATGGTLGNDGYVEVSNLIPGNYTVTETTPNNGTQFDTVTGGVSHNLNNRRATVTVVSGTDYNNLTSEEKQTAKKNATVSFTNNVELSTLTVTKAVESTRTDKDDTQLDFTFTVTLVNGEGINGTYGDMDFVNGVATFTLKSGESRTARNLPQGMQYTVTETEDLGFTTNISGGTVTHEANGYTTASGSTIAFTNTRGWGDLVLTKAVTVNGTATDGTLADGTYTFEVKGPGTQLVDTYRLSLTVENGEAAEARLTNIPAGVYSIREIASSNPHVPMDTEVHTVVVEDGKTGDNASSMTITNNVDTGSLVVSKAVDGENTGDADASFGFTVTLVNGTDINGQFGQMTFVNGVAKFTLKKGESLTATGLPVGTTYTVQETSMPNGFVQSSRTTGVSGTIAKDAQATAYVHNVYAPETSIVLTAKKTLEGGTLAAGQFSFEVVGPDGEVIQTATNAADGTVTFDAIGLTVEDAGKTLTYKIREVIPADATRGADGSYTKDGITYDSHEVAVEVKVTDNNGTLTAEVSYAGGGATFANSYKAEETPEGAIPRTGDTTPAVLPPFLLAVGLSLASIGTLLRRSRKSRPRGAHMRV